MEGGTDGWREGEGEGEGERSREGEWRARAAGPEQADACARQLSLPAGKYEYKFHSVRARARSHSRAHRVDVRKRSGAASSRRVDWTQCRGRLQLLGPLSESDPKPFPRFFCISESDSGPSLSIFYVYPSCMLSSVPRAIARRCAEWVCERVVRARASACMVCLCLPMHGPIGYAPGQGRLVGFARL